MNEEIDKLRSELKRLDHLYYNEGESEVEDPVYDSMRRRLVELEGDTTDPYSPQNTVGVKSTGGFEKRQHLQRMVSLDNIFNESDLVDWSNSINIECEVVVEHKYDGASLNLVYIRGKLEAAVTRGDGAEGDVITDNAIHISGVPVDFANPPSSKFEIRGEVICRHEHFKKICLEREAAGKRVYANPRNMVAGVMRRQSGDSSDLLGLEFIAYEYIDHSGDKPKSGIPSEIQGLDNIVTAKPILKTRLNDVSGIITAIENQSRLRKIIPYDIDGMVIKVSDPSLREKIGSTIRAPRWATAYKFEAEIGTSILRSVEVQVGRTGVLTPVAKIDPVRLAGVTITSVTLHNYDEIERLGVRIGDTVVVARRGDVIPKIERVVESLRVDEHGHISAPTNCPVCDGRVVRVPGIVERKCIETMTCPAQVIGRLSHFVSRDGVGIMHFGEATVEALVASGSVASFSSIYYLTERDMYAAGFSELMSDKLLASINKSRKIPFHKALRAVGIPDVGEGTSTRLAKRYKSFEELSEATEEDLLGIADIGETTVASIGHYFVYNKPDMLALDKVFTYIEEIVEKADVQDLLGAMVVVTGSDFEGKNRKEMEADVVSRGGRITTSISKNTDYVYAGTGAGPDKIKKAVSLGFVQDNIRFINPKHLTPKDVTDAN